MNMKKQNFVYIFKFKLSMILRCSHSQACYVYSTGFRRLYSLFCANRTSDKHSFPPHCKMIGSTQYFPLLKYSSIYRFGNCDFQDESDQNGSYQNGSYQNEANVQGIAIL